MATMSLAGRCARTARNTAIMLTPVAAPLSTTITRRPAGFEDAAILGWNPNSRRVGGIAPPVAADPVTGGGDVHEGLEGAGPRRAATGGPLHM